MSAAARVPIHRLALVSAALVLLAPSLAQAKVRITVDLDKQTIHVEGAEKTYDWKVSSGAFGHETPSGQYGVLWMDKDHHSDEYDQAPMPNAIFFAPGYAIHGAFKSQWGHPASHGCVRLPVAKSAILFDMVKAQGADVTITGYSPNNADTVKAEAAARKAKAADAAPPDGRDRFNGREAQGYGYPDQGYDDPAYAEPAPARASSRRRGRDANPDSLFGSVY